MATKAENVSTVYEEVFKNIQRAAESNLKMQQELFQQWGALWPGFPTPQAAWLDKVRDFQKQWTDTISDLANKHREVLNQQYQASLDSLEEALRVAESSNPEEFRERSEQFMRKALECVRDISESQMKEFQDAANKWSEFATKATA